MMPNTMKTVDRNRKAKSISAALMKTGISNIAGALKRSSSAIYMRSPSIAKDTPTIGLPRFSPLSLTPLTALSCLSLCRG